MPARLAGMRTVLIVLFDGVQSLDVTGPLEVFNAANRWCLERAAAPGYAITTASLGAAAVRTTSGLGGRPPAGRFPAPPGQRVEVQGPALGAGGGGAAAAGGPAVDRRAPGGRPPGRGAGRRGQLVAPPVRPRLRRRDRPAARPVRG